MTFTGLSRRFRGTAGPPATEHEVLIGASADRTFACPTCTRPLVLGQGRCPGCGSLLVAGVLVRTALFLVLVGSVVGMMGGAVIAGVAMGPRLAAAEAAQAAAFAAATPIATSPAAVPSAPAGAGAPSSAPAGAVTDAGLPRGVMAGLLQVASVNDRLARSVATLTTLLADRRSGAGDIAPVLRKIAADARSGGQAASLLTPWSPATALAADAARLYAAAAASATSGLAAPLSDDAAYVSAGRRMLMALAPLAEVDAVTRAVAGGSGITLAEAAPLP